MAFLGHPNTQFSYAVYLQPHFYIMMLKVIYSTVSQVMKTQTARHIRANTSMKENWGLYIYSGPRVRKSDFKSSQLTLCLAISVTIERGEIIHF